MIGFDTIGNATLVVYDGAPILACDPWIRGSAYFGSWCLAHDIPSEQLQAVRDARHVWFSHAHPDHLNAESLDALAGKTILLADHVGGRVAKDLRALGFTVRVLPDRQWVELSPHVRVLAIADPNQDSILLVDVGGRLVIDLNDASDRGWSRFVRRIARRFTWSYLLRIGGYGDADMINLFDEEGRRITPFAATKPSVGLRLAQYADLCGARFVIPFSSFHAYQREDSVWANEYTTPVEAHAEGFRSRTATILPAYLRVDCERGEHQPIAVAEVERRVLPASAFGDDWSEPLEASDADRLRRYVQSKQRLRRHFGFVSFVVGGKETVIDLNPRLRALGITFAVPRRSLCTAVEYEVFDDLLIGNFMKTTLRGNASLYPHFTPVVAKHSDNGRAHTQAQYLAYVARYFARAPIDATRHLLELRSEELFRRFVPKDGWLYARVKKAYWLLKRGGGASDAAVASQEPAASGTPPATDATLAAGVTPRRRPTRRTGDGA